jgi:phosphoribosylanthranilate isomerase
MTNVKICGITTEPDAIHAAKHGADMLGFIFANVSRRYIAPADAQPIIASIKTTYPDVRCIGVFVALPNLPATKIDAAAQLAGVDAIQIVGELTPDFLSALQTTYYVSIRPRTVDEAHADAERFNHPMQRDDLPTLHLDAFHEKLYGGTGETAALDVAQALAEDTSRLMLSGGLNAENVADAITQVQPWAVDVASGTDRAPGQKDPEKVRQFIQAAKRIVTP